MHWLLRQGREGRTCAFEKLRFVLRRRPCLRDPKLTGELQDRETLK